MGGGRGGHGVLRGGGRSSPAQSGAGEVGGSPIVRGNDDAD